MTSATSRDDVAGALAAPYDSDLVFRTEVRPQLYLASAGLLVVGLVFTGYFLTTPEAGFAGILAATVGVFMLYIAWINVWVTRAGYPHLVLRGHRLSVLSSPAARRDLDLTKLGEGRVVVLRARKSATRIYFGFQPAPGVARKPLRVVAPELAEFAETVFLNGYIGADPERAKPIADVINARRLEPAQAAAPPPDTSRQQAAARVRLIATAAVFAALWVALIWWRVLP